MFKPALISAAALFIGFGGTAANAEAIRLGAATSGIISINTAKLVRYAAPARQELNAPMTAGCNLWAAAIAAMLAGTASYIAIRDDNQNIMALDCPGA